MVNKNHRKVEGTELVQDQQKMCYAIMCCLNYCDLVVDPVWLWAVHFTSNPQDPSQNANGSFQDPPPRNSYSYKPQFLISLTS
jgi:hypothetical protein